MLRSGSKPFLSTRKALVGHATSNWVLGVAALYHSWYFLEKAGVLEYLAGILVIFLLVTGTAIALIRRGSARRLAAALHLQRTLSLLLLTITVIHIAYH